MAMLAILLGLALTLPSSTALETNILIVDEVNLTVDLDPPLEISKKLITEDNIQVIVIENVDDPLAGNATITVTSLIVSEKADPHIFSSFLENIIVGLFELEGDKEVGNLTVTDNYGRNVRVHTFSQANPSTLTGRFDFATWYIDEWNYISLVSSLNDTTKIIETLAIAP